MTKVTIRFGGDSIRVEDYDNIIITKNEEGDILYIGRYLSDMSPMQLDDGNFHLYSQLWEIGTCKMSKGKFISEEAFMDLIRSDYPDDYEFILWNPEVLELKYDE